MHKPGAHPLSRRRCIAERRRGVSEAPFPPAHDLQTQPRLISASECQKRALLSLSVAEADSAETDDLESHLTLDLPVFGTQSAIRIMAAPSATPSFQLVRCQAARVNGFLACFLPTPRHYPRKPSRRSLHPVERCGRLSDSEASPERSRAAKMSGRLALKGVAVGAT